MSSEPKKTIVDAFGELVGGGDTVSFLSVVIDADTQVRFAHYGMSNAQAIQLIDHVRAHLEEKERRHPEEDEYGRSSKTRFH